MGYFPWAALTSSLTALLPSVVTWAHCGQVCCQLTAPYTEQQILLYLMARRSTKCFDRCEMLYIPPQEGGQEGLARRDVFWGLLLVVCSKCEHLEVANSSWQAFSFLKKKGWACPWSTFVSGTCVISLTWCGAFEENVAVVLLKNNKSYGIPLNSENVGNIGRKGTKHFKVLVWRKRFWIKQFYVILQVVWAIILYVRLYHCSLECSYNTDLIMHRKKISHLLDSFLLFKSRKEQKGSYFLKEIVRFYCRKVAACAELEL